jgi:hypothetical protein
MYQRGLMSHCQEYELDTTKPKSWNLYEQPVFSSLTVAEPALEVSYDSSEDYDYEYYREYFI